MPPKKKKRKPKQPTQRQSQKQVVNITFADKKNKRRKKRPQAKQSVKKDNLQMAVQSLSSNLNMFSSDTARLNNLENLITELRREQRQPITTGIIKPTSIMATQTSIPASVMETQTDPLKIILKKTKKTQTKPIPILTPDLEEPLIPAKTPKPWVGPEVAIMPEEGDLADLLNPLRPLNRFVGKQEPLKEVKKKLKIKIKKRAEESAEKPRGNVVDEPIQGGGVDTDTEIPVELKKQRKTYKTGKKAKADEFYKKSSFATNVKAGAFESLRDNLIDARNIRDMQNRNEEDKIDRQKRTDALAFIDDFNLEQYKRSVANPTSFI